LQLGLANIRPLGFDAGSPLVLEKMSPGASLKDRGSFLADDSWKKFSKYSQWWLLPPSVLPSPESLDLAAEW
jgi:hypothetical protein